MRVTANNYLTLGLLGEVWNHQLDLQNLFLLELQRLVVLTTPDTSAQEATIPFCSLINIIERNIDTFAAHGFRHPSMQNTVTWLGGLADTRRLDFTDVNRWFESVELIGDVVEGASQRLMRCGVSRAISGLPKNQQIIRTVN